MEKTTEKSDSKIYELGILLVSSIPEEKVGDEVARIKEIMAKNKAEIISEEAPKLRKLAYTMVKKIAAVNKKFENAYFGWIKFETTSEGAVSIKKEVEASDHVLRLLLINTLREDTLLSAKLNLGEKDEEKKSVPTGDKAAVSTEDLDKSIDKTVEELAV